MNADQPSTEYIVLLSRSQVYSELISIPKGRIFYHWPDVQAEGHVKRIVAKLKELQSQPPVPRQ